MIDSETFARQFEAQRPHLRAVAYRMLGSLNEAEDAVQDTWLRASRADTREVENLGGWLTTVVGRICLNILRSRRSHREEPLDTAPASPAAQERSNDPEQAALQADAVGLALLVVLDRLGPAERLAFVLHDMFAVPFEEIAPIVERTPAATRQLTSRARRRVRGAPTASSAELGRQRDVVDAFLAAARGGDLPAMVAVLDPDIVLRYDNAALRFSGASEVRGAASVAEHTLKARAVAARPALIDGTPGVIVAPGGTLLMVLTLTVQEGKVIAIETIADPDRLSQLEIAILDD